MMSHNFSCRAMTKKCVVVRFLRLNLINFPLLFLFGFSATETQAGKR